MNQKQHQQPQAQPKITKNNKKNYKGAQID